MSRGFAEDGLWVKCGCLCPGSSIPKLCDSPHIWETDTQEFIGSKDHICRHRRGFSALSQRDLMAEPAMAPSKARPVSVTGHTRVFRTTQFGGRHPETQPAPPFPRSMSPFYDPFSLGSSEGAPFPERLRSHRAVGDWHFAGPFTRPSALSVAPRACPMVSGQRFPLTLRGAGGRRSSEPSLPLLRFLKNLFYC